MQKPNRTLLNEWQPYFLLDTNKKPDHRSLRQSGPNPQSYSANYQCASALALSV